MSVDESDSVPGDAVVLATAGLAAGSAADGTTCLRGCNDSSPVIGVSGDDDLSTVDAAIVVLTGDSLALGEVDAESASS